jgi:hypothetical protein
VLGHGLPRVISGPQHLLLWGPGDLRPDDPVLIVGARGMELQPYFDNFSSWAAQAANGMPRERPPSPRPRPPPAHRQLWPKVKVFI